MMVLRWLRFLARFALGVSLLLPVIALPVTVWLDRGPAGETRISPHGFPLVLWLFDDFAWTCARNSVIFAAIVALLSLMIGGVLGWVVARRRFWGRAVLRGLVVALLAVPPVFWAVGLDGIWGAPRPWPWPFSGATGASDGVSLESWSALPLWIEWIWSTLPWGVALVTVATAAAVEQLEPSWEDAASLTGAGRFQAWRALSWPLLRPSVARAGAAVFVFTLAEPGAPLVLGLRRTLAFQVIDTAARSEPFPQAAAWAVMTGLFAFAGWTACRWAGGTSILRNPARMLPHAPRARPPRAAAPGRALFSTLVLAGWAFLGWLPFAGLARLAIGGRHDLPLGGTSASHAFLDELLRMGEPPVPAILVNSLALGLVVAIATIALASLRSRAGHFARSPGLWARLGRRIAFMPPLAQGLGLLAILWLSGRVSTFLIDAGQLRWLAVALQAVAAGLDPYRNPWLMLPFCVALSLAPRFLIAWPWERRGGVNEHSTNSARDAARLFGVGRARAARLTQSSPPGRWLAAGVLAGTLAATNLVPALFFELWSDGHTLAPAVLDLASGPAGARGQAAALALLGIACNLAALAWGWLSSALPHAPDLE